MGKRNKVAELTDKKIREIKRAKIREKKIRLIGVRVSNLAFQSKSQFSRSKEHWTKIDRRIIESFCPYIGIVALFISRKKIDLCRGVW
jgi:hypothetical protein